LFVFFKLSAELSLLLIRRERALGLSIAQKFEAVLGWMGNSWGLEV
jgi:hypothetical protein